MSEPENRHLQIAREVRDACIKTVMEAHEDASMNGLCREGALESAIGAVQSLDLEAIIQKYQQQD